MKRVRRCSVPFPGDPRKQLEPGMTEGYDLQRRLLTTGIKNQKMSFAGSGFWFALIWHIHGFVG